MKFMTTSASCFITIKVIAFFAMPFASHEYYKEAIEYMIDYAKEHQFPFMIDCAVPSFVEKLKKGMPWKVCL